MDDMDEADRLELAGLRSDVQHLMRTLDEIKAKFNGHPTLETFQGLKDRVAMLEKIVFGGVCCVVLAVLGAVIGLVIQK